MSSNGTSSGCAAHTAGARPGRPSRLAALAILAAIHAGLVACGGGGESSAAVQELAAAGKTADAGTQEADAPGLESLTGGKAGPAAVPPPADTEASPPGDPVQSTPAAEPAAPLRFSGLRILPLGDSMTAGGEGDPTSFRSYRGALQKLLGAAGHDTDFVGTLSLTPAIGGDPDHNGYGGAQIGPGGSSNNIADRLDGILANVGDVDVVILAMGWNSAYQEPANAASKYEGLVRRIAALRPAATIVLGTLSPQRAETEQQTNSQLSGYRELNARARQLAGASATDKLILADFAATSFSADEYWDVIHWLQPGANKAARVIFDAMTANADIINSR